MISVACVDFGVENLKEYFILIIMMFCERW